MKKIITLVLMLPALASYAQPKIITQAIVNTKTTVVVPEGEEDQTRTFTTEDGQERVVRFNIGNGETKSVTTLKNDMVKTFTENESSRTTLIRDNAKKTSTTILEMMGKKTGFIATDEEQAQAAKRIDSMMQSRNEQGNFRQRSTPVFTTEYIDETKKIAGYTCKKALVIDTTDNKADTTIVWYCPDFKLQNITSTGGIASGFAGMVAVARPNGMENLDGFPMQYEKNLSRGRKMTVQVTKLVIDKDVADKEFEIPKDIVLKTLKEMENGGGPGNVRIVVGG
ncbi:MAG: hypothetical protein JST62_04800 [Bacteroidetes bacterium]|nr:hypothetical protein [Bacteroidota bacterium]